MYSSNVTISTANHKTRKLLIIGGNTAYPTMQLSCCSVSSTFNFIMIIITEQKSSLLVIFIIEKQKGVSLHFKYLEQVHTP